MERKQLKKNRRDREITKAFVSNLERRKKGSKLLKFSFNKVGEVLKADGLK